MTPHEIESALNGPLQAVLSVSRSDRGPVAVPMSFRFDDGVFKMITMPGSLHGRLMQETRRATITVHHDDLHDRRLVQWYVMAEGPVEFTGEDPAVLLREILAKDRGPEYLNEWTTQAMANVGHVAVLTPARLSGYLGESRLD